MIGLTNRQQFSETVLISALAAVDEISANSASHCSSIIAELLVSIYNIAFVMYIYIVSFPNAWDTVT